MLRAKETLVILAPLTKVTETMLEWQMSRTSTQERMGPFASSDGSHFWSRRRTLSAGYYSSDVRN